jgi:hypothetical protein
MFLSHMVKQMFVLMKVNELLTRCLDVFNEKKLKVENKTLKV